MTHRQLETTRIAFTACFITLLVAGCNRGPQVVPVEGKVLYQGKPLTCGSVMFQPEVGKPARGMIQADGSFRLSTFSKHDGAIVGKHRVRVVSLAQVKETSDEGPLGESLIPKKYENVNTSELEVDVTTDGNSPVELNLSDV